MKKITLLFCFMGSVISANAENQDPLLLSLFADQQWYISPKPRSEQLDFYTNAGGRLRTQKSYTYWFYGWDSTAQLSLDKSEQNYISIPSAHTGWQIKNFKSFMPFLTFIKVVVGRYINHWSQMDQEWQLSIWHPQNLYDPLRPQLLGFVGTAVILGGDLWSFKNFAGGVFLPDERPSFHTNALGEAQSASRWVSAPSSNISLFEQDIYSYYKVEDPYLKNVLLQPSYMGQFILGDLNEKWISASYADKPLNQIFFRADSKLSIPSISVESSIYYHSIRHRLGAIETGFKLGEWNGHIGFLNEQLEDIQLPPHWLFPIIPSYFFASAGLSKNFSFARWSKNTLKFSLLKSWVRDPNQAMNLIGADTASLISLDRFKFKEGFFISWSSDFFYAQRTKAQFFIRYWYSIDQKGGWLESRFSFWMKEGFAVDLELDILGKKTRYQEGFFGKYGSNDRIKARVRYDF